MNVVRQEQSPVGSGQRRGRPDTRAALLDAVDTLLNERGWEACSLQAVARRAGLTTGAIYSTFGSRGALISAAVLRHSESVARLPRDELDLRVAVAHFARDFHALGEGAAGRALIVSQLDMLRLSVTDDSIFAEMNESYRALIADLASDIESRATHVLSAPATELAQRMVATLQGLGLQNAAHDARIDASVFVTAALTSLGL